MAFRQATRKQAKLRLALCGPSGSGKTYSALLIAQGLTPDGKIALVDTEHGSGELYADLAAYDVAPLEPPFTPARYIELIREAEQGGYDVLILDSLSHAWSGSGGVLDMKDAAAAASRSGNGFAAWREITPLHNQLVDTVLGANLHIIATMRTKTAYEVVEDERGKKAPRKIGLAPVQREGMEYEFTTVIDLSVERHVATATKDRTRLFDGQHFTPEVATGEILREWLETGVDPVAENKRMLRRLKGQVSRIEAVPHLNNWWHKHRTEIESLTAEHKAALTEHCAKRKAAVLAALEPPPPKGNGQDHTPAGIDAVAGTAH